MKQHKIIAFLAALLVLGLLPGPALAAPPPEGQQVYVVQADDWLSRLADKFYGDPLIYPLIVEVTNNAAAESSGYTPIENVDNLQVGQKLLIPPMDSFSAEVVEAARQKAEMAAQSVASQQTGPTQEQRQLLTSLDVVGQPPELFNQVWLNSDPLKLANLHGQVVIVEFWTFG